MVGAIDPWGSPTASESGSPSPQTPEHGYPQEPSPLDDNTRDRQIHEHHIMSTEWSLEHRLHYFGQSFNAQHMSQGIGDVSL